MIVEVFGLLLVWLVLSMPIHFLFMTEAYWDESAAFRTRKVRFYSWNEITLIGRIIILPLGIAYFVISKMRNIFEDITKRIRNLLIKDEDKL